MTDQCLHCEHKGSLKKCLEADCSQHENWYAKKQQWRIDEMKMLIIDMQATLRTCFNTTETTLAQAEHDRERLEL